MEASILCEHMTLDSADDGGEIVEGGWRGRRAQDHSPVHVVMRRRGPVGKLSPWAHDPSMYECRWTMQTNGVPLTVLSQARSAAERSYPSRQGSRHLLLVHDGGTTATLISVGRLRENRCGWCCSVRDTIRSHCMANQVEFSEDPTCPFVVCAARPGQSPFP